MTELNLSYYLEHSKNLIKIKCFFNYIQSSSYYIHYKYPLDALSLLILHNCIIKDLLLDAQSPTKGLMYGVIIELGLQTIFITPLLSHSIIQNCAIKYQMHTF
jgi:hypothetical protein